MAISPWNWRICIDKSLTFILFNGVMVAHVHTDEDEGGTHEEPDGDLFTEQPPGKENGGDGVEIDPVGGDDDAEMLDDKVPGEVADHGGYDAEEHQVPENGGAEEDIEGREFGAPDIIRYHGEETVEKHFSCDEERAVTFHGSLHQQGIESPTDTGHESEQIA